MHDLINHRAFSLLVSQHLKPAQTPVHLMADRDPASNVDVDSDDDFYDPTADYQPPPMPEMTGQSSMMDACGAKFLISGIVGKKLLVTSRWRVRFRLWDAF